MKGYTAIKQIRWSCCNNILPVTIQFEIDTRFKLNVNKKISS